MRPTPVVLCGLAAAFLCASSFAAPAENRLTMKPEELSLGSQAAWKLGPLKKVEGFSADGSLEKWDAIPAIDLPAIPSQLQIGKWSGEKDLSFRLQAAWDDANLYLAVKVRDNVLCSQGGGEMWRKDSVQVGFGSASGYGPEYGLTLIDGSPDVFRWSAGEAKDSVDAVKMKAWRKGDITFYDVAFPWTAIWAARPEGSFKMNVIVNDCDGAERLGWVELTPGIGKSKDPSKFAVFSFENLSKADGISLSLDAAPVMAAERGAVVFKAGVFNPGDKISESFELTVKDASGKKLAELKQPVILEKGALTRSPASGSRRFRPAAATSSFPRSSQASPPAPRLRSSRTRPATPP